MNIAKRSMLCLLLTLSHTSFALPSDTEQQIDIQANHASFDESNKKATYTGNVELTQGSLHLNAEELRVEHRPETEQSTLIAIGTSNKPVSFKQQVDASGQWIQASTNELHYFYEKNRVELVGNASVKRGETLITGDKITYFTDTHKLKAQGDQSNAEQSGRVRISLPPRNSQPESK